MYLPKIKRYQKKFEYSYAFGAYPVIDLLKYKAESVYQVLLKKDSEGSDGIEEVLKLCNEKGIPFEYADRAIERISVKENTYVVAVFKKYESELQSGEDHVVLVNPSNQGNLGTIIRTMLGFNLKNLGIVKPAVDIFDPLVVRATMGSLFHINFEYFNSFEEYSSKYSSNNIYPFMLNGAKDITQVEIKRPFTIVHGNESSGLPVEFKDIGEGIFIPHSKDIDSLNLSVATAISLWEIFKRRV